MNTQHVPHGRIPFFICTLSACLFALGSINPLWAQGKKSALKILFREKTPAVYKLQRPGTRMPGLSGTSVLRYASLPPTADVSRDIRRAVSSTVIHASRSRFSFRRPPTLEVKEPVNGVTEIIYGRADVTASDSRAFSRAIALIQKHKKCSSPEEALAWIQKNPLAAAREYGLPRFQNKAYIISDLSRVTPDPETGAPYPAPRYAFDFLRGMHLDPTSMDVHTVLQAGLDIRRSGFPVAFEGRRRGICMSSSLKVVNQHIYHPDHVPFIFHISWDTGMSQLNGQKLCEIAERSIAPEEIMQVSAFLKINGKHQWGQIERLSSGNFLFRPYAPAEGTDTNGQEPASQIPQRIK